VAQVCRYLLPCRRNKLALALLHVSQPLLEQLPAALSLLDGQAGLLELVSD